MAKAAGFTFAGPEIVGSLLLEIPAVYGHADDGLAVHGVYRAEPVGMITWAVSIYPLAIANHMFMKIFFMPAG